MSNPRAAPAETDASAGAQPPKPERPDVFFSYSRKDLAFVQRLAAELLARGKDVWVDWEDIRKSADWRAKVEGGIESSRAVVAVLSPDFATSDVCGEEIDHAVEHNKRLVPIVRDEVDRRKLREQLNRPELDLLPRRRRLRARGRRPGRGGRRGSRVARPARTPARARARVGASRAKRELSAPRQRPPRRRGVARAPGVAQRGGDRAPGRVHRRQPARGHPPLAHHAQLGGHRVDRLARARRARAARVAAVRGERAQRQVAGPRLGRARAASDRPAGERAARRRGDEAAPDRRGAAGASAVDPRDAPDHDARRAQGSSRHRRLQPSRDADRDDERRRHRSDLGRADREAAARAPRAWRRSKQRGIPGGVRPGRLAARDGEQRSLLPLGRGERAPHRPAARPPGNGPRRGLQPERAAARHRGRGPDRAGAGRRDRQDASRPARSQGRGRERRLQPDRNGRRDGERGPNRPPLAASRRPAARDVSAP